MCLKTISLTSLQFVEFCCFEQWKTLNFTSIVLGGVLPNRPSIWSNFTCCSSKLIEIPSIKRNHAIICVFVRFPILWGIAKFSSIFLRGTETLHMLRGGFFKIIDIPLRKRILQNPHLVKLRKKRVSSAEIFNQNLSRFYCEHPLSLLFFGPP